MLSGGTQRRAFALVPERRKENIKKITIHSPLGIEPTTVALQSNPCAPEPGRSRLNLWLGIL